MRCLEIMALSSWSTNFFTNALLRMDRRRMRKEISITSSTVPTASDGSHRMATNTAYLYPFHQLSSMHVSCFARARCASLQTHILAPCCDWPGVCRRLCRWSLGERRHWSLGKKIPAVTARHGVDVGLVIGVDSGDRAGGPAAV